MNEFEIIAKMFAPLSKGEEGAFDLKDDCAVVSINNSKQLVVTSDTLVAGRHFLVSDPPELIGRKCLCANVSDLAAMGAKPRYFLLSSVWPSDTEVEWIQKFSQGLQTAQSDWEITLIGGDTVSSSGPLALSITAIGEVNHGKSLLRSGASIGDDIFVTGTIGDATLGLLLSQNVITVNNKRDKTYFVSHFQSPEPRHKIGEILIGIASSATDVSDSLAQDMMNVLNASNVSAQLNLENIPFSSRAKSLLAEQIIDYDTLLTGGDDYELLFTAPPSSSSKISYISSQSSVPITCIGKIVPANSVSSIVILDKDNKKIQLPQTLGFSHF